MKVNKETNPKPLNLEFVNAYNVLYRRHIPQNKNN